MVHAVQHTLTCGELPVSWDGKAFASPLAQQTSGEITARFFGNAQVTDYVGKIADPTEKIPRAELQFHLQALHLIALDSIVAVQESRGKVLAKTRRPDALQPLLEKLAQADFTQRPEGLFDVMALTTSQVALVQKYSQAADATAENGNFLVLDFPGEYLKAIEWLVFPNWYTACFMSECHNSAVWGHYGGYHGGVCLIFSADEREGVSCLPLNGIIGMSTHGPARGAQQMKFWPVEYAKGFGEINFFRSLGRLSANALNSMWYTDAQGKVSECMEDLVRDERAWRARYWANCYRDLVRKTSDWAYEHEYRLILTDGAFTGHADPATRIYTYDFASLKGLIFGINTKIAHKLKIIRIIEKKCRDSHRTDFKFYQAVYSSRSKAVEHREMNLLRFGGTSDAPAA
jgi:Protein of unknown function (DUF2971)